MAAIASKNTKPELVVRKIIHSLGFRYRLHRSDLPGKPDIVFGPKRKVIFVHGCFWHQHPDPACADARLPKSNSSYWVEKLKRNSERDAAAVLMLRQQDWDVMLIWECETQHQLALIARLRNFLASE